MTPSVRNDYIREGEILPGFFVYPSGDHYCRCEEERSADAAISWYHASTMIPSQMLYREIATAFRPRNDIVIGSLPHQFTQVRYRSFSILGMDFLLHLMDNKG